MVLQRNAILCGSAPLGFTQKKLNEMHGFLISSAGGAWREKEITVFPNGVSEAMLLFVLGQLKSQKIDYILLYICTETGVADGEKSVWLGGEEIHKEIFLNKELNIQVVFDSCRDFIQDDASEAEDIQNGFFLSFESGAMEKSGVER